jgi:hypothetical protein
MSFSTDFFFLIFMFVYCYRGLSPPPPLVLDPARSLFQQNCHFHQEGSGLGGCHTESTASTAWRPLNASVDDTTARTSYITRPNLYVYVARDFVWRRERYKCGNVTCRRVTSGRMLCLLGVRYEARKRLLLTPRPTFRLSNLSHSFCSLYDRSIASSKASSPQGAI